MLNNLFLPPPHLLSRIFYSLFFITLFCLPRFATAQTDECQPWAFEISAEQPPALNIQAQTRYYVNIQAAGQPTGQSWTDAFTNLHDALVLALPGDEIWVAEGIYHPADNDRSAHYQLPSGVQLYGGFAGSEMLLEERQPAVHPSILDGDIGTPGDSLDNSYNLLYLPYPDKFTLLDGFTLRNAVANDPNAAIGQLGAAGAAL